MKRSLFQLIRSFTLIILLSIAYSCSQQDEYATGKVGPAELVIKNAEIYTVDAARSWAQALAVRGERLVYVGTNLGVKAFIGPKTQTVDLGGRLLLPGFHDSHVHLFLGGVSLGRCILNEARSLDEILAEIKSYAQSKPGKSWILGGGWNQSLFPEATPHKSLLDSVVPDRPVMLWDVGLHSIWVNSKALEIAGITPETKDPDRGRIERDPETGEPSGTLRESAAKLVEQHVPEMTDQERLESLQRSFKTAHSFGIVSLQEANASPDIFETYEAAEDEGFLTARVRTALYFDPAKDTDEQINRFLKLRKTHPGPRLNAGTVKLFIDGVIDSKTAVLLESYEGMKIDDPEACGIPNFNQERLNQIVTRLDNEGFQVHMHTIGEGAIRMGLDAIEQARHVNGFRDTRHHLSHLNIIHPEDLPRFYQLRVVATFQPFWAAPYPYNVKLTPLFLGPERMKWQLLIRSVMDSGAVVAAGSDWNVTSLNPLDAIQVAITRQIIGQKDGSVLDPEQRVSLASIVASYTTRGAYVNFEERNSGSIDVGKWADFIVLDKNLFKIPVHEIHKAKVLWTFVEGKEVYRASDWEPVFD